MSDEPTIHSLGQSIHDLDKNVVSLMQLVESDIKTRADFEKRTDKRLDLFEARLERHSDRLARVDVIQAESRTALTTIIDTFKVIRGQLIRLIVGGFSSVLGILTVAGGALVYFLKG